MQPYPGLAAITAGITLETPRLRLRLPRESDLDAFAAMYANPETMRHIGSGNVMTREETWRAIAAQLGHWVLRGYGMWAVELKDGGAVVGRVGFLDAEGWPGFELGWLICHSHQGSGYATEAARVARDYALETLKRERIIHLIRPENVASIRVAEKLGARLDGELDVKGSKALVYAIQRF